MEAEKSHDTQLDKLEAQESWSYSSDIQVWIWRQEMTDVSDGRQSVRESDQALPEAFALFRPSTDWKRATHIDRAICFTQIQSKCPSLPKTPWQIYPEWWVPAYPGTFTPHGPAKSTHNISHHTGDDHYTLCVDSLLANIPVSSVFEAILNIPLLTHSFSILKSRAHLVSRTFPGSLLRWSVSNLHTTKVKYGYSSSFPLRIPGNYFSAFLSLRFLSLDVTLLAT